MGFRSWARVFCGGLALATNACALWAVPPMQASVGVGGPISSDRESRNRAIDLSAGVHPLQGIASLRGRSFDVGAGYAFYGATELALTPVHGGYLEGSWLFYSAPGNGFDARLALAARGRMFVRESELGAGAALRIVAEVTGFADGELNSCGLASCIWSVGVGEGGVGLYAEASYSAIEREQNVAATVGVVVRIPMSIGGAIFMPMF